MSKRINLENLTPIVVSICLTIMVVVFYISDSSELKEENERLSNQVEELKESNDILVDHYWHLSNMLQEKEIE